MTGPTPAGQPLGPQPPRSRMRSCLPEPSQLPQQTPGALGGRRSACLRSPPQWACAGVQARGTRASGPAALCYQAAVVRAQACRTASEGACPVLGTDVTMNPGASLSTFTAVPFPPPIPGAQHRPPWQQHLPRPITPAFPPGSSLLLPAFPRTPLVANGGHGPSAHGACNLTVEVRSQGRTVEAPQTQTSVVTQAPLNWSAPGALSRSAACPAPEFIATPVMGTVVTASAVGVRQAGKGGWTPGFPPQALPPAAQLAPIIRPVNSGPWPHGASREGRLATNQSSASQDGSSNPQREYSNFRRWQRIKPLARRHFHLSPDAEAFSCFLIPVLRSVARLNPNMPLEEGLWRAVQEWRCRSNPDRVIYYERAEKFMEFAAEEEMHIQNLQCMQCAQDLPPPAPPKLDPRGPPAPPSPSFPSSCSASACAPRMSGPRAQPSHPKPHRSQRNPEPKAPKVIPPETVREYVDRMEALAGHVHSATGKSPAECGKDGNELNQEEDDTYLDPCLLSCIDELRSREDSVTKVEAVIHPRFPAELFSPDPQLDVLALAEELKQEEGLTPEELVQKRVLALKEEEGGPAAPSHSAPGMGSSPSESHAGQGAQRHDQDRHRGVSDEACPPEIDFEALHRPIRADTGPFGPKVFVPSRGRQEVSPFRAGRPSPPQGQRRTGPLLGPRDASVLGEASPVPEARGPRDASSEHQEELPSLAPLLASPQSLPPCWLSQSPAPASGAFSLMRGKEEMSVAGQVVLQEQMQVVVTASTVGSCDLRADTGG
ncbi:NUT family member 2G-like [Balaenoptera acutorostrata]|uniref:NUT family member 2G-like n=1 Tax=Balaenoptera acutorostrata TaxID=9767 RepID=A0ABM3SZF7_BALAC|nr:NUT family member 2G-like [Balaenoptera acutorostrata]